MPPVAGQKLKKDESKTRLTAPQRRQQIIAAALPLFAQEGFRGVTTKELAREAGVSEALLYQHFPSKDELYAEVQRSCCNPSEELRAILEDLEPSTETLTLLLFMMVKVIVEGVSFSATQDPLFPRLMLHSLLDDGAFARLHFTQNIRGMTQLVVRCFAAARAAGDLVSCPDDGDDDLLFWFCHHTLVATHMHRLPSEAVLPYHDSEPAAVTAPVFRYMLRGIGLTPAAIRKFAVIEQLNTAVSPWLFASVQDKGSL